MKVCILGAGIGGLSVAHELIKHGFEVEVYERNSIPGGQARSDIIYTYSPSSGKGHTEYCWHVVGVGYLHLVSILKEIPTEDNLTVADHLKPISQFLYARENGHFNIEDGNSFLSSGSLWGLYRGIKNAGGTVTFTDIYTIIKLWLIANCSCEKRLENYDHVLWKTITSSLSPEMKKWIVDSPAIYLGMDIDNLSAHLMFKMMNATYSSDLGEYDFYSFDGPMNQTWFDPWIKFLKNQGVKFYFNHTIDEIVLSEDNNISYIKTSDDQIVTADIYINSLSIEGWSNAVRNIPNYNIKFKELEMQSRQLQTQVLYFFDKVFYLEKPTIVVLPDTPWCLMFRQEGALWNLTKGDILSVGIGIWSRNGIYHKKPASMCTREELAEEVWEQIRMNKGLLENLKFVDGNNLESISDLPEWNIWYSYDFYDNSMNTFEPKFSNNIGTLSLRPDISDETIENVYHATAYTRTESNIFCMESAAEAGRCVAKYIVSGEMENDKPRYKSNLFFKFLRFLDSIFLSIF